MTNVTRSHPNDPGYSTHRDDVRAGLHGRALGMAVVQINASQAGAEGRRRDARRAGADRIRRARAGHHPAPLHARHLHDARTWCRSFAKKCPAAPTTISSSVLIEGGAQFALVDRPARHARRVRQRARRINFGAGHQREVHAGRHARQPGRRVDQRHASSWRFPISRASARAVTVLGSTGRIRGYGGTARTGSWCSHDDAPLRTGFSLVETMIALGVLTVGVLGAAAVLATGMQNLSSSPADVDRDAEGGAGDRGGVQRARLAQARPGRRSGTSRAASGSDGGDLPRRSAAAASWPAPTAWSTPPTTTARSKPCRCRAGQTARHVATTRPSRCQQLHARDLDPRRRRTRTASCDRSRSPSPTGTARRSGPTR